MDITIRTTSKKQVVDITDLVEEVIAKQKWSHGLVHAFIQHTTAALTTADLDPGTDLDMLDAFEVMVPKLRYRHPHNPVHVPDHIMSSVIGPQVIVPLRGGELQLGDWQRMVLVELDGPRERSVTISLIDAK